MIEDITVSIIVPVYNAANYLQDTIQSVCQQSYKNIELILYNDGSTDESKKICLDAQKKDDRIIVINKPNRGPAISRNEGIEIASGKFIVFVDSDDTINKEFIEKALLCARETDSDFVMCGYEKRYPDRSEFVYEQTKHYIKNELSDVLPRFVERCLIQGPCWKLFKKSIIKKNGIVFQPEWKLGEDAFFVYSYLKCIETFSTSDYVSYVYNIRNEESLSSRFTIEKVQNNIELSNMLLELMEDNSNRDWVAKSLCGSFVTFCDELLNTSKTYQEKKKILKCATDMLAEFDIFRIYKENHIVRKIYRKFAIKRDCRLLLIITFVRKYIKKAVKKNE